MKKIIYILTTLIVIASVEANAVSINPDGTVNGVIAADIMNGTSDGAFYDWSSPDLSASSQRDPATSITGDALFTTFAFSLDSSAYVDLGFSTSVYNGAGDDLAFFVTGNPSSMDFSAVARDAFGNSLSITNAISAYNVQWLGNLDVNGQALAVSLVLIDLDNYGSDVFGTNALTSIQFNFGNTLPGLSLAGGIHSTATVVPLPLPIVLFGSGLGLLGWIGRRKKTTA